MLSHRINIFVLSIVVERPKNVKKQRLKHGSLTSWNHRNSSEILIQTWECGKLSFQLNSAQQLLLHYLSIKAENVTAVV